MSNLADVRKSKPIKITLSDGKEREIKFTLNAMAEIEDKYGSVEKAFEALEKNSFKALRTVLWAGLIHDDVNITEIAVGNLIDMSNVTDLIAQLNQAFDSDMPVVEKDPTGEVQNQHPNGKAPVVLAVQKQE